MRQLFTNDVLALAAGKAVSGVAREAHKVRVLSGRVWITMEGVLNDYWLHAGDELTLVPGALTVIEADGADSRMELASDAARLALPRQSGYAARLVRFARRFGQARNAGANVSGSAC